MQNDPERQLDHLLARWEQAAAAGTFLTAEELCPAGDAQLLAELSEAIECLKRFHVFETPVQTPGQLATAFRSDQYEGVEEIDEGGQGRVIRARDVRLGRDVAVKIVKNEWAWLTTAKQRFEQEARITGSLEHPGVIPIYGFGLDHEGKPYYAMRYVKQERTLKDVIEQTRALPPGPEKTVAHQNLLRTFLTMCRTVEFAHSRDIIHRDIKPDNVLVGDFGEVFVTDWGIAKSLTAQVPAPDTANAAAAPSNGRTAGMLGTAAYMSPEQAQNPAGADKLCDVFSLGATLYHLLTGRPPRPDGNTPAPAQPRRIDPTIPPALEAVCLKTMHRDPRRRYPSAGAIAVEIERWLADEPVGAWPEPLHARARRWMKRHRTAVTGGVVLLLMSTLTLAVTTLLLTRWNEDRAGFIGQLEKEHEKRGELIDELKGVNKERGTFIAELKQKNTELADALYLNQFLAANAAWEQMDIGRAEAILDQCDPARRCFEWHFLKNQCQGNRQIVSPHQYPARSIAVSNDGKLIAITDDRYGVRIIETATGKELPRPKFEGDLGSKIHAGTFHPEGKQFAAVARISRPDGSEEYLVRWNPSTGETFPPIQMAPEWTLDFPLIAYRNDGRELAFVHLKRLAKTTPDVSTGIHYTHELTLVTLDAASGKRLGETSLGQRSLLVGWEGRFARDGNQLVMWRSHTSIIRLFDVKANRSVALDFFGDVLTAAFSPDGRKVAAASSNGAMRIWDAVDGRKRAEIAGHKLSVKTLAFSPDGFRLASAGEDRGIKISDTITGHELRTIRGHTEQVNALGYLPDHRLLSAGKEGSLSIWRLQSEVGSLPLYGRDLAFSPDGKRLFSSSDPGVSFCELDVPGHDGRITPGGSHFSLSPDGARGAVVMQGGVEIWDIAQRQKLLLIPGATGPTCFSPDGKRLAAVAIRDKAVAVRERTTTLIMDVETGKVVHEWERERKIEAHAWTPDSKHLLTYTRDSIVTVTDLDSQKELTSFDTKQIAEGRLADAHRMVLSRDGRYLATSGNEQRPSVRVWDPLTGRLAWETRTHVRPITDLAFSADSRRLATASADKSVKIWTSGGGQELLSMPGIGGTPRSIAFSPDDLRLACGCPGRPVMIWPPYGRP